MRWPGSQGCCFSVLKTNVGEEEHAGASAEGGQIAFCFRSGQEDSRRGRNCGRRARVSTFLLNAALLEEYVKQAKDREDIIAALRLELEMQKLKNLTTKSIRARPTGEIHLN